MKITIASVNEKKLRGLIGDYEDLQSHSNGLNDRLHDLRQDLSREKTNYAIYKQKCRENGSDNKEDPIPANTLRDMDNIKSRIEGVIEKRRVNSVELNASRSLLERIAMSLLKQRCCPDYLTLRGYHYE